MQNADHTRVSTEMFLILSKGSDYTPDGVKEETINFGRLIQTELIELLGQSEYDMEVSHGQKISFTGHYPSFALDLLALGAMAISARVVRDS